MSSQQPETDFTRIKYPGSRKMKLSSWEIRFLSVHPPIFVLENASASRGSTIIGQGIWIRPLRETSPPTSATPKHVITMIRDFLGCVVCFKQILSKTMRRPILSPEVTASPHFTRTISPELSRTSVFFGGRDPFICASTKHIIEVANWSCKLAQTHYLSNFEVRSR